MADPIYHSGAEGVVLCNSVDWEVQGWNFTETTNSQPTTNTSDYDPVTKRTWTRRAGTTTEGSGSFNFIYNSLNDPWPGDPGPLEPGQIVPASFQKTSGAVLSGQIYIDSTEHQTNGPEGLQAITVNFHNPGKLQWS